MAEKKDEKLHNLRHSLAHILASAVMEMFPKAQLGIGPVIENGFYYDFLLPRPLGPEDLSKLEKRMRELVRQRLDFTKEEMSFNDGISFFEKANQPFKVELIEDIQRHGTTVFKDILGKDSAEKDSEIKNVSLYHTGKFTDLCRGGHVQNTSEIKTDAFKLEKTSGAYWRGDQAKPQMQRVYGLAFETKEELESYVKLQEELAKRDHKVLGPKLGLFLFNDASPGIPFYQPKGAIVRRELEKFVREEGYGEGYGEVRLPQMFESELWKTSGHWDHYKDDMFTFKVEGKDFALKPMNCPGHMLLFKQGLYSYKDLPLRFAEMSTLHRNELSGALGGLTRVRAFAQDDCHIFVTPDQISDEIAASLKNIAKMYKILGMSIEQVHLATRPEQSLGSKEEWDSAEKSLMEALKKAKWEYELEPGDGAFYGPKIDMKIKDTLGRLWQLATLQLDFQMPKRFGLEYIAKDGSRQTPVVIHRAILGSFERFMAILIEQYGGAFPSWLAPVQVQVIPVSQKQKKYAKETQKKLKELIPGLRSAIDERDESVGKKIRDAQLNKVPYMIILGEKEVKSGKLSVRNRDGKEQAGVVLKKFAEKLTEEIAKRK